MKIKQFTLKALTALFALSLLSLSSCKKDDDDDSSSATPAPTPAPTPTKKELLTGKYWKVTDMTVSPAYEVSPGVFITDYYSTLSACSKDNVTFYTSNGEYVTNEGAIKCNLSDPQTVSGTWNFNTPETILTAYQSGTPVGVTIGGDYTLIQLNATTLKYQQTMNIGTVYTFTTTLSKQ